MSQPLYFWIHNDHVLTPLEPYSLRILNTDETMFLLQVKVNYDVVEKFSVVQTEQVLIGYCYSFGCWWRRVCEQPGKPRQGIHQFLKQDQFNFIKVMFPACLFFSRKKKSGNPFQLNQRSYFPMLYA